jgi:hypothetical protein
MSEKETIAINVVSSDFLEQSKPIWKSFLSVLRDRKPHALSELSSPFWETVNGEKDMVPDAVAQATYFLIEMRLLIQAPAQTKDEVWVQLSKDEKALKALEALSHD